MTLLELCEPLFQYVCRLNRLARKGGRADPAQVAAEIRALMGDLRARAEKHPQLMPQVERIELPLIFFADFMVRESRLNYGSAWKGLAAERREVP